MLKGSKHSSEAKKRISDSLTGDKNPMFGISRYGAANSMFGKKHSEETKMKLGHKNEKHYEWKGDDVGYDAIHEWIRRHLSAPKLCQMCNNIRPFDLANITGIYNRDFKNWKYLCRSCHMKFDFNMGFRK